MRILRALTLCAVVASGVCNAHQDRIVEIGVDGTLVGIPAEFAPAKIQVAFTGAATGARISSLDLILGNRRTHLPICVTGVINSARLEDVRAYASWYHEEKERPYYLNVEFLDPGYKPASPHNPGYSLLFNLRTARLIQMTVLVSRENDKALQLLPLDLAAMCSKVELDAFKDAQKVCGLTTRC
jgi:hypothetical protein